MTKEEIIIQAQELLKQLHSLLKEDETLNLPQTNAPPFTITKINEKSLSFRDNIYPSSKSTYYDI